MSKNYIDSLHFKYETFPLKREGILLHLNRVTKEGTSTNKNILLIHGVTFSTHIFDVNYEDYSLVKFLAKEGYNVWSLDVAGYGESEKVNNGFMPDSNYAAEDVNAAINKICELSNENKIDVMGWSWGTVVSSRCVIKYPKHVKKLVLYAPILNGIGKHNIVESFHHNTYECAIEDFQKLTNGKIDYSIVDPMVVNTFVSNVWKYDKEFSPNGGRRDISIDCSNKLISLENITIPTMIICGNKDPYLNYESINSSLDYLPVGSKLEIINGGSHVAHIEKPFYKDFQSKLINFCKRN